MKTNRLISLLLCLCMVFALFTGMAESASAADDYITYTIKSGDNLYTLVGKMGMNYGTVKYVIMALNGFTNEKQLSQLQPGQTILLPTSNQAAASLASKALTSGTASTAATVTTTTAGTTAGTTAAATTTTASSTTSGASTYQGYTAAYYLVPHTVAKGETLISICKALGTNYYDYEKVVLTINNMASANSLKVGQQIWVPAKTGSAGGTIAVVAHSVKSGETISGICDGYKTSYANYKSVVQAVNSKIANVEKLNAGQVVYIPVYTTYNTAVAGNASTAAGTSGSPTTNIATGYAIGFTVPASANHGNPFAIVGGQSNVTRAAAGQTVVIRPNAYSGYAVKSVKVVRTDSNAHIQVNDYAFTMPNSNVQITIEYASGITIRKMPSAHGSFDTMVYGELSQTAFYGDRVEIVPYANAGYEVGNVQVIRTDTNAAVPATVDADTGLYYFTMPNAEVRITVTFQVSTRINLFYNRGMYLGYGIVQFYVDGVQVTQANQGDTVRMVIIPADGWVIDPDTTANGVLGAAVGAATANPNFNTVNNPLPGGPAPSYIAVKPRMNEDYITKINDYTYEFKIPVAGTTSGSTRVPQQGGADIPVGDVNVYVGFKQKTPFGLFKENLSGNVQYGTVTFTVTDPVTGEIRKNAEYAFEGDIVELVPYAPPVAETIGGFTPTGRFLTYTYNADGTATGGYGGTNEYVKLVPSLGLLPAANWIRPGYQFRMPASAVNVEPQFYNAGNAATDYSGITYDVGIADNAHGKIEILDAAGNNKLNQAAAGATITVRITADKGYRVKRQFSGVFGATEYGVYVNFGDFGTPELTPLVDGIAISSGGISNTGTAVVNVNPANLREYTNNTGNAVLEFNIVTPRITNGGTTYGTPIIMTALYDTFSGNYQDGAGSTTVTNSNLVTLNTANIDAITGVPYAGRSPALETAVSGVSGLSNIEMYVNGALVPDGTTVSVGTLVGFKFTVRDGYKLDSVWKRTIAGGGFDQELSPIDGIYWYTVTDKDADASTGNPVIRFEVTTEQNVAKQYSVFYSMTDPSGMAAPYTINGTAADLNGVTAGTQITINIPTSFVEALSDDGTVLGMIGVRLAAITVDGTNLTMGDLTDNGTGIGWTYTFVMPDHDVRTEVKYVEATLLDP